MQSSIVLKAENVHKIRDSCIENGHKGLKEVKYWFYGGRFYFTSLLMSCYQTKIVTI